MSIEIIDGQLMILGKEPKKYYTSKSEEELLEVISFVEDRMENLNEVPVMAQKTLKLVCVVLNKRLDYVRKTKARKNRDNMLYKARARSKEATLEAKSISRLAMFLDQNRKKVNKTEILSDDFFSSADIKSSNPVEHAKAWIRDRAYFYQDKGMDKLQARSLAADDHAHHYRAVPIEFREPDNTIMMIDPDMLPVSEVPLPSVKLTGNSLIDGFNVALANAPKVTTVFDVETFTHAVGSPEWWDLNTEQRIEVWLKTNPDMNIRTIGGLLISNGHLPTDEAKVGNEVFEEAMKDTPEKRANSLALKTKKREEYLSFIEVAKVAFEKELLACKIELEKLQLINKFKQVYLMIDEKYPEVVREIKEEKENGKGTRETDIDKCTVLDS